MMNCAGGHRYLGEPLRGPMSCHRVKGAVITVLLVPGLFTWAPVNSAVFHAPPSRGLSPESPLLLARNGLISSQDAANIAQQRYGGKVLSVQLRESREGPEGAMQLNRGGSAYYEVKLLLNGNIRVVHIGARQ